MVRYKSMENKIRKVYVWMNSECIKFVQNKLLPKREMPTKTGTSMLTIWYILLMKIEEVLPELYRFAEVCYNHTLHPLWTLSLQHPDTRINHFSITYVCKRNSQDIVHHFVLDCPNIFKRREHLRNFYCPWIHTSSYHAHCQNYSQIQRQWSHFRKGMMSVLWELHRNENASVITFSSCLVLLFPGWTYTYVNLHFTMFMIDVSSIW